MIGRPGWFQRRKYGGWGITPATWQGWIYITLALGIFIAFQAMPFWSNQIRMIATLIWAGFLLVDVTHIMITLKKDEREHQIEAIAERNAAWFMAIILVIGVLYQVISSAVTKQVQIDWFLVAALLGGTIVKTVSNMHFER